MGVQFAVGTARNSRGTQVVIRPVPGMELGVQLAGSTGVGAPPLGVVSRHSVCVKLLLLDGGVFTQATLLL